MIFLLEFMFLHSLEIKLKLVCMFLEELMEKKM